MRINSKWEVKKLGEICEIVNGGTPKTNVKEYWNGTNLWITPAEMGKREIPFVEKTVRQLSDSGLKNSSAKLLPPYSVILSSRAPIGHLVINKKPMATNQGCKGLIPSGKLFYLFLYYYLYFSVDYLDKLGTGTTFKELPTWKLKEVEVPFPLLSEQKRIVAKLDKFSENIKRLDDAARKNLQNAKDLFNSVLNETFKNKSAVANDNRQVYKKAHWEVKKLGEICIVLVDGNWIESKDQSYKGIRLIQTGNIGMGFFRNKESKTRFITEETFKRLNCNEVFPGDCLISRLPDPVGKACIVPSLTNKMVTAVDCSIIRFKSFINPAFMNYFFQTPEYLNEIKQKCTGTTRTRISRKNLEKILVPVSSLVEQKKIVARLDKLSAKTKKLEIVYQKKIDGLTELKKSVFKQTFDCG